MFGLKSATAIKQDSHKKRDLIKTILLKELNRSFKYSEAVRETLIVSFRLTKHWISEARATWRSKISPVLSSYTDCHIPRR
jgi:hypothetical protein